MKALRVIAASVVTVAGLAALLAPTPASADHKRPAGGHWDRHTPTATAVAQVYFEDFSGPNWPVATSVPAWANRPAYIRPYYKNANTCNNSVVHCVPVRSGNYGSTYYGGFSEKLIGTGGHGHFVHGSVKIFYNTYYSYGTNERREITCHEIGHAMGPIADGTAQPNTCMKPGSPYDFGPNGHDYNLLEDAYNH
jgi:hypothetical protein